MRVAEVVGGVVRNVVEVDPANRPSFTTGWPEAATAGPGWTYAGGTFAPPAAPPAPVPQSITFAQMLIGLVTEQWITEAEGDAWLSGTVPAAVAALIAQLPEGQRFAARARAVRPSTVLRNDPLVLGLAEIEGKSAEQMNAFFSTYARA